MWTCQTAQPPGKHNQGTCHSMIKLCQPHDFNMSIFALFKNCTFYFHNHVCLRTHAYKRFTRMVLTRRLEKDHCQFYLSLLLHMLWRQGNASLTCPKRDWKGPTAYIHMTWVSYNSYSLTNLHFQVCLRRCMTYTVKPIKTKPYTCTLFLLLKF